MSKRMIGCLTALLGLTAAAGEPSVTARVPDLDIRRLPLPENEALAFTRQMTMGFNLGNTFDAVDDSLTGDDLLLESRWVGVKTTKALIDEIYNAGFRTLRIPVSWHNHVDESFHIGKAWLDRVQEVVDWAYEKGMYVILNTHHDLGVRYYYPDKAHLDSGSRYLSAIWTQLALRFRDYGERLLFESMNEPRCSGTPYEWNYEADNPACIEGLECINRFNQVFVDTVRATGGENARRYLMVPSYAAAAVSALEDVFRLPEDSTPGRLIVSTHAYIPYPFALQDGGTRHYSMDPDGPQAAEITSVLDGLYRKYILNGIPVIMGEFGARDKDNLPDRVDFTAQYASLASARGIPCVWWDNHSFRGNGERFGLIDRASLEWKYPQIVEALARYSGYERLK